MKRAAVALLLLTGCAYDARPVPAELESTWEGDAAAPVYVVPGSGVRAPAGVGRDLRAPRFMPGAPAVCPLDDAGLACARLPR